MKNYLAILVCLGVAVILGTSGLAVWRATEDLADRKIRWHQEGWEAGAKGMPPDACPYEPANEGPYHEWKKGWQEGYEDRQRHPKWEPATKEPATKKEDR